MSAATQTQEANVPAAAPAVEDDAELRNNAVLSAPSNQRVNTALVRCSTCGVLQQLLPTQGADVGEWMPCALCWRALKREARLAYLPRFTTLSDDEQRPWRHRFTLIGVTEAELRLKMVQEMERGDGDGDCPVPLVAAEDEATADGVDGAGCAPESQQITEASDGQAQQPAADAKAEPTRCKACGGILYQGLHAA